MNTDRGLDFDTVLEHELQHWVGSRRGPSPAVHQAAYRIVAAERRPAVPLVPCLVAAATLALCGGSAVAAAAVTHSPDPVTWGQTITDAVVSCRTQLGAGEHGIGQCVSEVARKHGATQRDAHSKAGSNEQAEASPCPIPEPTESDTPQPSPKGRRVGNPNGAAPTASSTSPAASPSPSGHTHPTGRPSARPSPSPHHTPNART